MSTNEDGRILANILGINHVGTAKEIFSTSLKHSFYKSGDLTWASGVTLEAFHDIFFSDIDLVVLKGEKYAIKRVRMYNGFDTVITAEKL